MKKSGGRKSELEFLLGLRYEPFDVDPLGCMIDRPFNSLQIIDRNLRAQFMQPGHSVVTVCLNSQERESCLERRFAKVDNATIKIGITSQNQAGNRDLTEGRHGNGYD